MKLADKLEKDDSEILDKASGTIVSQVEALRKLVDAFGDYAQEPELNLEPLDVKALISEVVTLYQQGDSNLRFVLNLGGSPSDMSADSGRIRQLLHNLIRNSQEAGAGGPVSITIGCRTNDNDGKSWLTLEVRDNGPGFPDLVLEQPFEPYVSNKGRGSGLGLAICKKIVSEHAGRIEISNPPAGGARVQIMLPVE
jgi:nitrogen fixation/metabolism regulation signal transduction histidine kinase